MSNIKKRGECDKQERNSVHPKLTLDEIPNKTKHFYPSSKPIFHLVGEKNNYYNK